MSIINSYYKDGKPMIKVSDVYKKSGIKFDSFIVTFSFRLINLLLEKKLIEVVSEDGIRSISENYPVYRFVGTNIGIVKTSIGAPITSVLVAEVATIYDCNKAVIFGTCGSLDKDIPPTSLIVPSACYRDEGTSYHYMEPSDYIDMKHYSDVCNYLDELGCKYVVGKTWTTDGFYRETDIEMNLRKSEGCIVVEMEMAAVEAVTRYHGIDLYAFLYRADNLDSESWDKGSRDSLLPEDKRLEIINVAYYIAKKIIE